MSLRVRRRFADLYQFSDYRMVAGDCDSGGRHSSCGDCDTVASCAAACRSKQQCLGFVFAARAHALMPRCQLNHRTCDTVRPSTQFTYYEKIGERFSLALRSEPSPISRPGTLNRYSKRMPRYLRHCGRKAPAYDSRKSTRVAQRMANGRRKARNAVACCCEILADYMPNC